MIALTAVEPIKENEQMMKMRLIHLLFALALLTSLTPSTFASASEVVVDPTAVFLDIKIFWDNFANDLDLFLYTPSGELAGASQDIQALSGEGKEGVAVDNPASGARRAETRGWLNARQAYEGKALPYIPVK